MLVKNIYSYDYYKSYLLDRVRTEPKAGRGVRLKMAKAIGCQVAYISHVLKADRHFSVDQAESITRFFGLNTDEAEYFIWLVEKERAGTVSSKAFFNKLINQKKDKYLQLKNRVDISNELDDVAKSIYYSDSIYALIHMLVTIPKYQTFQSISEVVDVSKNKLLDVINFLKKHGLVIDNKGKLTASEKFIFLDKQSPLILQHHTNWRIKAIDHLRKNDDSGDIHLSMAVSLSEKDAMLIQKRISQFIQEVSETIKKSPEEKLMAFNIDYFSLLSENSN